MPDRIYIFNHKIDDSPYHYNAENSDDKMRGKLFIIEPSDSFIVIKLKKILKSVDIRR
jgi:hypothetical protein